MGANRGSLCRIHILLREHTAAGLFTPGICLHQSGRSRLAGVLPRAAAQTAAALCVRAAEMKSFQVLQLPTPSCDPPCGQSEAERSSPHGDQQIRARLRARETTAAAARRGGGIPLGMRLEIYCNIAALPTVNKHGASKLSLLPVLPRPPPLPLSFLSSPRQNRSGRNAG